MQLAVVGRFLLRLGLGRRDGDRQPRQNAQLLDRAAILDHALLDVGVVGLRLVDVAEWAEDHVGDAGGQVAPIVGLPGLDDHGVALRRARHIQRTLHREPLVLVFERVDLAGVDLAVDKRIVLPGIPQLLDQRHKLAGAVVAGGVLQVLSLLKLKAIWSPPESLAAELLKLVTTFQAARPPLTWSIEASWRASS